MTRTLTFVTPRYGRDVVGGAEQGARSLATRLASDGWTVSVLTSCARSHLTWANEYSPGTSVEEGVVVVRHPVDRPRDTRFDSLSARILPIAPSVDEVAAWDWIDRQGPCSRALLDAIAAVDQGVLAFYPYLYQPTARGIGLARVPNVLHAACHREPPLDLPIFRQVFRSAGALAHHTRAEQDLVGERFPITATVPQAVVGLPVEVDGQVDADAARGALGLDDEPFVVTLGRIDPGKGTNDLVSRFARFRQENRTARLVLAGPVVDLPPDTPGVTVLGPIPEDHKLGLLAAADALINPSPHESFSIVVVEAMLVGTPVLVNGLCAPLREHCENSGGGLWYTGIADFNAALGRISADPGLRAALGEAGRRYAKRFFSWRAVLRRYESLLDRIA